MTLPTQVLNEIRQWQLTIMSDIGFFTMHPVPDREEVAVRPTGSDPGVYLRAYLLAEGPTGNPAVRLILDDVVFDDDNVDLNQQIQFNRFTNKWEVVDATTVSG